MIDQQPFERLQQLLAAGGADKPVLFPPNSRYYLTDTAEGKDAAGRTVIYLRRRFVPPPEEFGVLREVLVRQGDRLDNVAAKQLGDPELFWQLCDANRTLAPEELEETGRRIIVPMPAGMRNSLEAQ